MQDPGYELRRIPLLGIWVNITPPPCPELDPYHLLKALGSKSLER
jgi:hypothetical protein